MALDNWIDKQDGIDDILAEDINSIANAVIETQEKINKIVIDQTYSPISENAQSGKAVAEAVSDKQDSLVSGTNIKTINNQSILGSGNITIEGGSDVEVDQIYSPTSENAQSGKAVAEAIALTVEIKPSKIDLPFEYNGGNSGEYFAKLISIDKISNTRSYLRFEFGGSTLNAYVNCPKDELVTYGLEIGKFYFIKISGEQISDKTMEIQKFSKISIDQNYNPESENAQSGKAVAEAVAIEQNRADNTFANALKGSKSGSAILIDDVSPVAHEISVVLGVGGATVAKYGKNLAPSTFNFNDVPGLSITDNGDGSISIKGAVAQNSYSPLIKDFVLPRGEYCVSGIFPSDWVPNDGYALIDENVISTSTQVITLSERKMVRLSIVFIAGVQYDLVIRPQIEVGTTSTEWEKYKEPIIYTADESGNVSGIVGNGNDITLTTNDDVKISVKYNKDINKMFTKLTQAIISLGGNV